ncbi:hypothetical protein OAN307_c30080 [Octadecabacter antarcticus 307]|uniref:BLUF domain-containing protein n=1 Tax=Octadecabacter antarcticus 307 TaxID=391626 RepID=M9R7E3_9RHOB|nr:BLUF domain-containing protein [Octadecabacter antarcticus]AGI68559.1 hypothetical protein OAN307_c30080 [Octadecabacter antarcticus 307]
METSNALPQLYRLIYVSHTQEDTTVNDIASILEISRYNNDRDNITGLLIYDKQLFFQALEGDRDAVEGCYARICRDARHGSPYIAWQGDVKKRSFTSWDMGYRTPSDLDKDDEQSVLALTDLVAKDVKTEGSDLLISVLIRVLFDGPKERDLGDANALNPNNSINRQRPQ